MGIRLALGAQNSALVQMILRESILLLVIGTIIGLPLSFTAAIFIKQQMFALNPFDPFTFATALIVVTFTTILAAWIPARRAANVDPVAALRCD